MLPEYKDYNKLTITLQVGENRTYVVSNINKKGLPSKATDDTGGSHLQSFSMELSLAGTGNDANIGSKGTMTLVDCNDALLKFLLAGFDEYKSDKPTDGTFPTVVIDLFCFTGEKTWCGFVRKWDISFSNGVPQIKFDWDIFPLDAGATQPIPMVTFKDPGALVKYIQDNYFKDSKIKRDFSFLEFTDDGIVEHKNEEISQYVQFSGANNEFTFDPSRISGYGNEEGEDGSCLQLEMTYKYILENLCYKKDGDDSLDRAPLIRFPFYDSYLMSVKKEKNFGKKGGRTVFAFCLSPLKNIPTYVSPDVKATNELLFVHNGNIPAYTKINETINGKDLGDRYCIPVENYSCNIDNTHLCLNGRMVSTINGSYYSGTSGTYTTAEPDAAQKSDQAQTVNNNNEMFSFSFKCSNVACFSPNNKAAPVNLIMYNENGVKRDYLCVNDALVRSVSYSLNGPIIEADVTCFVGIKDYPNPEETEGQEITGEDGSILASLWSAVKDVASFLEPKDNK